MANYKVIYTCIVGQYDDLLQPLIIDQEFDFICFSNDIPYRNVGVWEIRKIPYASSDFTRLSRYVKLMPHTVLKDYRYSIWIDANIQIVKHEFYTRINELIKDNILIAQVPHCQPFCDCIYEDMKMCLIKNKVFIFNVLRQYKHLRNENFPHHYGLYENNLIIRKHNDNKVKQLSIEWWNEYCRYSKRDQFSLVYIYWKYGFKPHLIWGNNKCARNIDCLKYYVHKNLHSTNIFNYYTNRIIFYFKLQINKLAVRYLFKY